MAAARTLRVGVLVSPPILGEVLARALAGRRLEVCRDVRAAGGPFDVVVATDDRVSGLRAPLVIVLPGPPGPAGSAEPDGGPCVRVADLATLGLVLDRLLGGPATV